MRITELLKERCTVLQLKSESSEGAIEELASTLRGEKEIVDFGKFLEDVKKREKLSPTGAGKEIALPHARTKGVKKIVLALGRSKKGIDFSSPDGKPARLIFLMGVSEEMVDEYLKILSSLSQLLNHDSFRESLLEAKDFKEIKKLFLREEEKRWK